ncbi:hypothetical protein PUNSTDRAFT_68800, partial [Punctularia strigosozonata HHB-11173 SS5]|uniref:uncharacterized protein n=1 Tax=Punctularia strigosozonata (strain HHB-11173) TaxID=741275 RepID=UPI000441683A
IEDRRGLLNGLLIFDILLQSGGIRDAHLLYPPRDPESLSLLLDAITNSTYDSLKKDCLVYFLIKWHEFKIDGSGGDRIREEMFVQERCIPPQFVLLADAYWYFDTGSDVERGVSILSDRRLNKDYASKIMQTIALSQNPAPLIVKYIRTARPLLTEPPDLNLYTEALLAGSSNGVLDAWLFQRTFPDCNEMKARLVRIIIDWCLTRERAHPYTAFSSLTSLLSSQTESGRAENPALLAVHAFRTSDGRGIRRFAPL